MGIDECSDVCSVIVDGMQPAPTRAPTPAPTVTHEFVYLPAFLAILHTHYNPYCPSRPTHPYRHPWDHRIAARPYGEHSIIVDGEKD
jgi:hypothetical protein